MNGATVSNARVAIRASAAILARLRHQHEHAVVSGSGRRASLLGAQLQAYSGLFDECDALMNDFLGGASGEIEPDLIDEVLWTLLIMQRFDLLGDLMRKHWSLAANVDFGLGRGRVAPSGIEWTIVSEQAVSFKYDERLLNNDLARQFFQRVIGLLPMVAQHLGREPVEPGTVMISLDDEDLAGSLGFCSARTEAFLVPDYFFVASRGYDSMRRDFARQARDWELRHPVALWRGSTTGIPGAGSNGWRDLPRIRLCDLARSEAGHGVVDASVTQIVQIENPEAVREIVAGGYMADYMPASRFQEWKYHIDIDGNTNSWPGLFIKLLTGSVVLKVTSPQNYRQWYYDRLKPWLHYVPVASDLSDLLPLVAWLRAHDDVARRIGRQGRSLAESLDYDSELRRASDTITAAIRRAGTGVPHRSASGVTTSQVEWAYRLILGRPPDSPDSVRWHQRAARDLQWLTESFLSSTEFKARLAPPTK